MLLEYMIDGEAILGGSGGAEPRQKELYNKISIGIRVRVKLDMCYFLCRRRIGVVTESSTCPHVYREVLHFLTRLSNLFRSARLSPIRSRYHLNIYLLMKIDFTINRNLGNARAKRRDNGNKMVVMT